MAGTGIHPSRRGSSVARASRWGPLLPLALDPYAAVCFRSPSHRRQILRHAKAAKDPDTELMRVFKSFDTDLDDRISASKIQKLRRCTTAEAKEMVATVDTDGDGFINIEEFGALLDDQKFDALHMAFEEYDENGDRMITAEELCIALRRVLPSEDLTVEKCAEMIDGVDKDGDGVISFDEFKAMTASKSS
ncbi:probable calcium-binding protein CML20 [Lolium perenne]|uniref:probable calcium-binding protein CML20 n=1 Tax=Lolium perenne TaxID=4522 RepID=UPI0021F5F8D7|nr:probable calcium-binding protein CML20 [Lolium perenne]